MAITWPSRPREDDLVIAWTDGQADGDKPNSDKPGRIIKQLKGEKICSTANGVKYSKPHYRITGKVLFILHIEKVLWWRNTGAQNPAPNMPKLTEERKTLGGISTRLEKDRIKVFVDSGSPAWRKFDGLKIGDGSKPIVIILPERCKTAGVIYGSSASAVLVFYSGTGREIARLRGVMPEVQRISAPKGELISKAKLCIEEGAPSAQMGKLTAIRKIE